MRFLGAKPSGMAERSTSLEMTKKADHAFRTAGYFSLFTLPFYSPIGAKRGMNTIAISLLALSYEDFAGGIVSLPFHCHFCYSLILFRPASISSVLGRVFFKSSGNCCLATSYSEIPIGRFIPDKA